MGISSALADFVAGTGYDDIPAYVIATQKKSILDAIGITLGAGTLGDGCRAFVELAEENSAGGAGEATVMGFGKKLPAVWAAFANAAMAHSLDFGDTQMTAVVHSNASTFPAALALAEKLGNVSGKELLTALVIGSEVACRVSMGANEDLEKYGWYMPTIYTSFGATAAAAKILGLDARQIVDALSFNLCQTTCSSELMNNSKTVVRSVREAFSARNAVMSALIAQKNVKGFDDPLEGKNGFYHAYARDNYTPERALDGLGTRFEAGTLYFKLWPSCAGTHPAIILGKKLASSGLFSLDDIERVHVVTSVRNAMLMEPLEVKRAPATSIIGKFSIPYTSAVAMLRGNVTLGDFMPEAFADEKVKALAAKFTYEMNQDWGKVEGMNTRMTVFTKDGKEFSEFYTEVGRPPKDTDFCELEEKLRSCASFAVNPLSAERLDGIISAVKSLDSAENISSLTNLL